MTTFPERLHGIQGEGDVAAEGLADGGVGFELGEVIGAKGGIFLALALFLALNLTYESIQFLSSFQFLENPLS
jgi:hypothetical protein